MFVYSHRGKRVELCSNICAVKIFFNIISAGLQVWAEIPKILYLQIRHTERRVHLKSRALNGGSKSYGRSEDRGTDGADTRNRASFNKTEMLSDSACYSSVKLSAETEELPQCNQLIHSALMPRHRSHEAWRMSLINHTF